MRIPTPEEIRIKGKNDTVDRLIGEIADAAPQGHIVITNNLPDFVREYAFGHLKAVGYSITEVEHGYLISWMP